MLSRVTVEENRSRGIIQINDYAWVLLRIGQKYEGCSGLRHPTSAILRGGWRSWESRPDTRLSSVGTPTGMKWSVGVGVACFYFCSPREIFS